MGVRSHDVLSCLRDQLTSDMINGHVTFKITNSLDRIKLNRNQTEYN